MGEQLVIIVYRQLLPLLLLLNCELISLTCPVTLSGASHDIYVPSRSTPAGVMLAYDNLFQITSAKFFPSDFVSLNGGYSAHQTAALALFSGKNDIPSGGTERYILMSFIMVLAGTVALLWYLFRGKKSDTSETSLNNGKKNAASHNADSDEVISDNGENNAENKPHAALYLFGDFTLLDDEGEDITKKLSPKLKQFFLMLFIRSCLSGTTGVRTEFITATLWPELSLAESKNNRNVSVRKIRNILSGIQGVSITVEKNRISLHLPDGFYCDLLEFRRLSAHQVFQPGDAGELSTMVTRGGLFADCDYEWFEAVRQKYRDETVQRLRELVTGNHLSDETRLLLAESILSQDSVCEIGIGSKIKSLSALGEHSSAKTSFEIFKKEYHRIFDAEFPKNIADFLH